MIPLLALVHLVAVVASLPTSARAQLFVADTKIDDAKPQANQTAQPIVLPPSFYSPALDPRTRYYRTDFIITAMISECTSVFFLCVEIVADLATATAIVAFALTRIYLLANETESAASIVSTSVILLIVQILILAAVDCICMVCVLLDAY